jgi:hypothetical protein
MALELETKIMQEIGLGMHYRWFNGSGSCEYVRQDASRKLQGAIQKHRGAGEQIVPPDQGLMNLMQQSTRWDESRYELTVAWQVASYVIAAHIHASHRPEGERFAFLRDQEREIRKLYR